VNTFHSIAGGAKGRRKDEIEMRQTELWVCKRLAYWGVQGGWIGWAGLLKGKAKTFTQNHDENSKSENSQIKGGGGSVILSEIVYLDGETELTKKESLKRRGLQKGMVDGGGESREEGLWGQSSLGKIHLG